MTRYLVIGGYIVVALAVVIWAKAGGRDREVHHETADEMMAKIRAPIDVKLTGIYGAPNGEIFVSGDRGAIFHHVPGKPGFTLEQPDWASINAIAGTDASNVWAVGDQLHVLHYNGHDWRRIRTDGDARLRAVLLTKPDEVWALGGDALVMKGDLNGLVNMQFHRELGDHMNAFWADPYGRLTLVGGRRDYGEIWEGDAYGARLVDNHAQHELTAVGGFGFDTWVTGAGTLWHMRGTTIDVIDAPPLSDGCVVWARAADDVWIGGMGGFLHYDGKMWTLEKLPNGDKLWLCGFAGTPEDLWMFARDQARDHGVLLHRLNGAYTTEPLPKVPQKFTDDFGSGHEPQRQQ
jgi:hypothetical protein